MIPPPPRSTLFPYTTLFRSATKKRVRRQITFHLTGALQPLGEAEARWSEKCSAAGPGLESPRGEGGYFQALTQSTCVTAGSGRSEEHTSELQSHVNLVCRLL